MRIYFLVWIFLATEILWAEQNQCYSGSSKNKWYRRALEVSSAPLVVGFRAQTAFRITEGGVGCLTGNCSNSAAKPTWANAITEIPKACIQSSLQRKVSQKSIECRRQKNGDWGYIKHSAGSKSKPCLDNSTVDFVHNVTNKVIACYQGLNLGNGITEDVDPKLLFSKINNESGFNFTYSYTGGTGMGQLTSSAVQEMNVLAPGRRSGKNNTGDGRFILDAILKSNKPECASLRPIIANDLQNKYHSPSDPNSICEWVSMETGVAKNLIYSIGFFSYLKHEIIGEELKSLAPNAYKDPEIRNLLTMVAYGPKGRKRALSLIRSFIGPRSNESIKQSLRNEAYLKATSNKLNEVKNLAGGACPIL